MGTNAPVRVTQHVIYTMFSCSTKEKDDGTFEHICDYVRIWSQAKSSAEFHALAVEKVIQHLRQTNKVPGLLRLRLWTDGHASTYKGQQNFGRMAEIVMKKNVEIYHCFFESHHASGVKDPRIAMIKQIGYVAIQLHIYWDCYVCLYILLPLNNLSC